MILRLLVRYSTPCADPTEIPLYLERRKDCPEREQRANWNSWLVTCPYYSILINLVSPSWYQRTAYCGCDPQWPKPSTGATGGWTPRPLGPSWQTGPWSWTRQNWLAYRHSSQAQTDQGNEVTWEKEALWRCTLGKNHLFFFMFICISVLISVQMKQSTGVSSLIADRPPTRLELRTKLWSCTLFKTSWNPDLGWDFPRVYPPLYPPLYSKPSR